MFALVINLISANMLLFGYIISDTKYRDLSEDIVKVVKDESECKLDVPKLIVGLDKAKQYAISHNFEFDILNRFYPNGDMWTFKKNEKREYYEEDILAFQEYIKNTISKNIIYNYINIFNLSITSIKKLYNIVINNQYNRDINYILIDNDMLYYPLNNNKVIGISLQQLRYVGIDKDKIINRIKQNKSNCIYYSSNKKLWEYKNWFNGLEYVIPSILTTNKL